MNEKVRELLERFDEDVKKILAAMDEDEPEKRKIDGSKYQGWTGLHFTEDCQHNQIFRTSADAMRAMIDFVNYYPTRKSVIGSVGDWIDQFTKIITDAGFACDINQRSE